MHDETLEGGAAAQWHGYDAMWSPGLHKGGVAGPLAKIVTKASEPLCTRQGSLAIVCMRAKVVAIAAQCFS